MSVTEHNVELLVGRCDTCGLVDHHLDPETGLCPGCKKIFGEVARCGYTVGAGHPNISVQVCNETDLPLDQIPLAGGFQYCDED